MVEKWSKLIFRFAVWHSVHVGGYFEKMSYERSQMLEFNIYTTS